MSQHSDGMRRVPYASDLSPEIQHTLSALADVETRYEVERRRLEHWNGPSSLRTRLEAQIEARRRGARQPLVQRLADLQREMMSVLFINRLKQLH